ncbi:MAG TPA: hypothetical protein VIM11_01830 [Tepidisphaeraceae bacterium]
MASKIIYAGTNHAVRYNWKYDAAGRVGFYRLNRRVGSNLQNCFAKEIILWRNKQRAS